MKFVALAAHLGGHPPRLLHLEAFRWQVNCCPLCAWMFGVAEGETEFVRYASLAAVFEAHFSGRNVCFSGEPCPICSFKPNRIASDLEAISKVDFSGPTTDRKDHSHEEMTARRLLLMYELVRACVGVRPVAELLRIYEEQARDCCGYEPSLNDLRDLIRDRTGDESPSNAILHRKVFAMAQRMLWINRVSA